MLSPVVASAPVVDAAPGALTPQQAHRPTEARHVDQRDIAAAVTMRDDPTHRARHHRRRRFHGHLEHTRAPVMKHRDHVQTVEADKHITPLAIARTLMATRAITRRMIPHRRGLPVSHASSQPTLEASTPSPADHPTRTHPHLNSEEPDIGLVAIEGVVESRRRCVHRLVGWSRSSMMEVPTLPSERPRPCATLPSTVVT